VSNWTRDLIERVQLRFILRLGLDDFRSASSTASVVETESDLVLGNRQPDPISRKTSTPRAKVPQ
jgi:hypothetical protein